MWGREYDSSTVITVELYRIRYPTKYAWTLDSYVATYNRVHLNLQVHMINLE